MFSPLNSSSIAMCPTISSKSSSSDNHENSVFQSFLPDYWWNDIGVMEKAFKWTVSEKKMLDDAYKEGAYGRGAFSDDLNNYTNVLRRLVKQRLWEMSKNEQDDQRREWLIRNCRQSDIHFAFAFNNPKKVIGIYLLWAEMEPKARYHLGMHR